MYTVIGWIGMILFLVNYALVAHEKIDAAGWRYNAIQVVAAAAVAVSLLPVQAWSTITLEGFFVLIGLRMVYKKLSSKTAAGH